MSTTLVKPAEVERKWYLLDAAGKSLGQFHITHSKYIGGLKKVQYSKLMAEHSDLAMTYAVKGMIPSNTIGAKALTRLHCYQGAEHAHAAQKPEKIEF